jgi:hypothetical protein
VLRAPRLSAASGQHETRPLHRVSVPQHLSAQPAVQQKTTANQVAWMRNVNASGGPVALPQRKAWSGLLPALACGRVPGNPGLCEQTYVPGANQARSALGCVSAGPPPRRGEIEPSCLRRAAGSAEPMAMPAGHDTVFGAISPIHVQAIDTVSGVFLRKAIGMDQPLSVRPPGRG